MTMRALLRRREARLLLAGQTLSFFGDSAMFLVLGIWAKDLTGSNAAAGLVFFVLALPQLGEPLAGWVVDRLPRRPVVIAAHGSLAVVMLLLLLVDGREDLWLIYLVAFLYGAGGAFSYPARNGLLKTILPDELLADANGLLQSAREGFRLVAPLLGAGLYASIGGAAVAIFDAATFVGSVVTLALISVAEPKPDPPVQRFLRELAAGAQHIWAVVQLRQIVGAVAIALIVIGFIETAMFAVVDEGLGRPPAFLGVLEVFQGVGAVAAGLTAARAIRRFGEVRVAGVGLACFAAGVALVIPGDLAGAFAGFAVAGIGVAWTVIGFVTALQRLTPLHLQGRVSGTAGMAIGVPQTFSIALGAVLITVVDWRLLLAVMGAVTLACGIYLLTRRPVPPATEPVPVAA
jgi:MFS family permease